MKKILLKMALVFSIAPIALFKSTEKSLAVEQTIPSGHAPLINVFGTLYLIRDWLFSILLVVAVIFIIIAGYLFVTAQGEPEKILKAKHFLLYALIGVLVALSARGLIDFIETMVQPSPPPPIPGEWI